MRVYGKNRHQKRRIIRRLMILFGWLFVIFSSLTLLNNYFRIRKIECYTQYGLCKDSYYQSLGQIVDKPILKKTSWDKALDVIVKDLEVKSVISRYKFPNTAVFKVTLRKPLGQVGNQALSEYAISDTEGLIVDVTQKSNLPLLLLDQRFHLGDRLSPTQMEALKIISLVNQIDAKIAEGSIVNNLLTINSPPGPIILLDLDKVPAQWYPTLQVILARSKILSRPPKTIDMRFNNPTISF
jgi:cell division septal protein FtsQ